MATPANGSIPFYAQIIIKTLADREYGQLVLKDTSNDRPVYGQIIIRET